MPKKLKREKEKISLDIVKKVASIARLDLTEKELRRFQRDLNDILIAFKDLDEAKAKCEPSFQPLPIKDVMREDSIEKTLTQEKALKNTKHKWKRFFKGPRVV